MTVTCTKNGRLEITLTPSDVIDQSFIQEFQKASRGSNPPKVRVEGSGDSISLVVFLDKLIPNQTE